MKIALVSDLHLEFEQYHIPHTCEADVLVLAGDVCVVNALSNTQHKLHSRFHEFFVHASERFNHVVYVLGNHEFYHGDFNNTIGELKQAMLPYHNIHVLECDKTTVIDYVGVPYTFAGCTLWTGMNCSDPTVQMKLQYALNDFHVIKHNGNKLSTVSAIARHQRSVEFLLECSGIKNLIVVTHHAPSFKSVHERFREDFDMNCGFATNLDTLVEVVEPTLWLHGHMHDQSDYYINQTRVVCNPRGYPGENSHTYQPHTFVL